MFNTTQYIFASLASIVILFVIGLVRIFHQSLKKRDVLATPSIPENEGIFTIQASSIINASVDEVFQILTEYEDYSKWNSFILDHKWEEIGSDGAPVIGSKGTTTFNVEGFISRVLPIKLTALDHSKHLIAERSIGYPSWLLSSERVQEVLPVEGDKSKCEYRTWQTLVGLGAYYLHLIEQDDLLDCHKQCAKDLKFFIERRKWDHGKEAMDSSLK